MHDALPEMGSVELATIKGLRVRFARSRSKDGVLVLLTSPWPVDRSAALCRPRNDAGRFLILAHEKANEINDLVRTYESTNTSHISGLRLILRN
jgi:hypothetical protein